MEFLDVFGAFDSTPFTVGRFIRQLAHIIIPPSVAGHPRCSRNDSGESFPSTTTTRVVVAAAVVK